MKSKPVAETPAAPTAAPNSIDISPEVQFAEDHAAMKVERDHWRKRAMINGELLRQRDEKIAALTAQVVTMQRGVAE